MTYFDNWKPHLCGLGIIATNVTDAKETATSVMEDFEQGLLKRVPDLPFNDRSANLLDRFSNLIHPVIDAISWEGYTRIAKFEESLAGEYNSSRPRAKIESQQRLLRLGSVQHQVKEVNFAREATTND